MQWEGAQYRRRIFSEEELPPPIRELADRGDINIAPPRADGAWPLIEGDIRMVDFTGWAGAVDVVAGGVPCQPWSLGGVHKGYDDRRNMWPELFRCVRETRLRAILAENVRGLLRPSFRAYYEYILRELAAPFEERVDGEDWRDHDRRLTKALGDRDANPERRYDVKYLLVNAAGYGVPQVRHRVFVVAFRRDLGLADWEFPAPTHSEAALLRDQAVGRYWRRHGLPPRPAATAFQGPIPDGTLPWRTVRDAIGDMPEPLDPLEAKREHPGWTHHVGWPGAREYRGHTPKAAGGRENRIVTVGGQTVLGSVALRRKHDGRRVYAYLRWSDHGRTSERYLGEVDQLSRAQNLAQAWRIASRALMIGPPSAAEGLADRFVSRRGGSWASSPAVRAVMQGNKGSETRPELAVRSAVHALGLRYRVGVSPLPGVRRTADLVIP